MKTNLNQPIIDSMLDEWLGKRRPNPVSVNTLNEQSKDPQRIAELEQAMLAASNDLRNRSLASSATAYRKPKRHSNTFRVLATLAACLVVCVGAWAFVNRDQFGFNNVLDSGEVVATSRPNGKAVPSKDTATTIAAAKESLSQAPNPKPALSSKGSKEALPLDALPFNTQDATVLKSKKKARTNSLVAKLDEEDVIKEIDRQLLHLWNTHDARPAAPISGADWIGRVTNQLLARSVSQEELDSFVKKDNPAMRMEAIHRIVSSSEFSQVWARRLAAYYLDIGSISMRDATPERQAFVRWIGKEINQTSRLDSIVKNIVLAHGISDSKAEPSPIAYWWADVGLRGETAPAEVIATKFLGSRASCSRCHDAKSVANADQAQYWGLAAITHGIEVSNPLLAEKPTIRFRKEAAPLFYERNDATMVAAVPSLPNGQNLKLQHGNPFQLRESTKQNLSSLNDWILQSDELATSHANFVWKTLFGQPLVTSYPLHDFEANNERMELASILGQQLRANEYDLRKIVTWIAASQAFGLESIRQDGDWYLRASDKDLELYRSRQFLFATFPAAQDRSFKSLDNLAAWFESSKVLRNDRGSILANPLPSPALPNNATKSISGNSRESKKVDFTEGQVQYLVNAQKLPKTLQDEVDRMIKSNLEWELLVDHAFFMTGTSAPTFVDREAAQRILDWCQDKRLAISRIIAARL